MAQAYAADFLSAERGTPVAACRIAIAGHEGVEHAARLAELPARPAVNEAEIALTEIVKSPFRAGFSSLLRDKRGWRAVC